MALRMHTDPADAGAEGAPVSGPRAALLADGRLHLQHGPIDLVIAAQGPDPQDRVRAYRAAVKRMQGLLGTLVDELPRLREPLGDTPPRVRGTVARRMVAATWPHRDRFGPRYITPMAAVAGSVADLVLEAMLEGAPLLQRAYVNNGGDIALWLAPGQSYRVGVVGDLAAPAVDATVTITAESGIRGVATSGWRGRSLSLGIADAVTVLAADAATADAATKPIAAAVDAPHPAIRRAPAASLRDDSDLRDTPVVADVGDLPAPVVAAALDRGERMADILKREGRIAAAWLQLQGTCRIIAPMARVESAA